MAKYRVDYAPSFFADMDKLDRATQQRIAHWIDKYLVDVDFPRASGKYLTGKLSGYVRFRVANYRIIAAVDNGEFVLTNLDDGHRSEIYRKMN